MSEISNTRYIFDMQNIRLPNHLYNICPKPLLDALQNVRHVASGTFAALKHVERQYNKRFYRMCPRDSEHEKHHYYIHVESVRRLFNWKADHEPCCPTLAPSMKLSPFMLHFHVEEAAYAMYAAEYARLRMEYLDGPHRVWIDATGEVFDKLEAVGAEFSEMEMRQFCRWWGSFLREMRKWEDRFDELVLPSWKEIVEELYDAIEERVELDYCC